MVRIRGMERDRDMAIFRAKLSVIVCILHVCEEVARKELEYMPTAQAVHEVEPAEDHVPALQVRQDDDCKN